MPDYYAAITTKKFVQRSDYVGPHLVEVELSTDVSDPNVTVLFQQIGDFGQVKVWADEERSTLIMSPGYAWTGHVGDLDPPPTWYMEGMETSAAINDVLLEMQVGLQPILYGHAGVTVVEPHVNAYYNIKTETP